jgi:hypothetical protein
MREELELFRNFISDIIVAFLSIVKDVQTKNTPSKFEDFKSSKFLNLF